ncbi:hypothetical protein HNY73_023121 [Argiope bruennichi]|uniref:Uncharacterized protein n=1 Tax=Argiope bruennichi TaxID=94029 RepID=A0A8T0E2U5_ARGBR|nr:hypothetical protein HNY73_023121 [Argiope bruennichi]
MIFERVNQLSSNVHQGCLADLTLVLTSILPFAIQQLELHLSEWRNLTKKTDNKPAVSLSKFVSHLLRQKGSCNKIGGCAGDEKKQVFQLVPPARAEDAGELRDAQDKNYLTGSLGAAEVADAFSGVHWHIFNSRPTRHPPYIPEKTPSLTNESFFPSFLSSILIDCEVQMQSVRILTCDCGSYTVGNHLPNTHFEKMV